MDRLPLTRVLNDSSVRKYNPVPKNMRRTVQVVYRYCQPFSASVINYAQELKRVNTLEKLKQTVDSSCDCSTSSFSDKDHGHVVTGNMDFIQDIDLKKILNKGTNFRFQVSNKIEDIRDEYHIALKEYCKKLVNRCGLSKIAYNTYCEKLIRCLEEKLSSFKNCQRFDGLIGQHVYRALKELQFKYIFTPADKAGGNIIIICKKFYFMQLSAELGIAYHLGNFVADGNEVYKPVESSMETIVDSHVRFAKSYNLSVLQKDMMLPRIFAIPKLHKNPVKMRYISGASKSSIRGVSLLIQRILKHLLKFLQRYCSKIVTRTGRRCFWSVDNTEQVLHRLKRMVRVQNVLTADFTTLFTTLPHSVIKSNIFELVNMGFRSSGLDFINVTSDGRVNFVGYNGSRGISLTKQEVMELISFGVNENYVMFGGVIMIQTLGTPIGGVASAQYANAVLSMQEFRYAKVPTNSQFHAVRYVDDLAVWNAPDFMNYAKDIYGNELKLEVTHTGRKADFLDLTMEILDNNQVRTSVFQKTDLFPFKVNRYGYPESNVSMRLHKAVIYGQLLRFARICSTLDAFVSRSRNLLMLHYDRKFAKVFLADVFLSFVSKNRALLLKFKILSHRDVIVIFNKVCGNMY